MPVANFQQEMRVNVEGPIFLTKALTANLQPGPGKSEKGRVLMISSGAADMAIPTMGAYCITKSAMKMAWMVLRDELKDHLQVGYCIPGLVATEITDNQVKDSSFAL